ncbi:MAG: riboflavin synthase [Terriglobia bacterium]
MFTGIIEEVGSVAELTTPQDTAGGPAPLLHSPAQPSGPRHWGAGARLRIKASKILPKLDVASSVAVSGCCLTVTRREESGFWCDLSPETLHRTGFRRLRVGSRVNLEAPLTLATPLGGHIVQGHVDATGTLLGLTRACPESGGTSDDNYWLDVDVPEELTRYLVEKGSVAVEGISLTVAAIEATRLRIAIIPFTYENSNLCTLQPGDPVNLESDVLAKYLEKLLLERPPALPSAGPATRPRSSSRRLTLERLREEGF